MPRDYLPPSHALAYGLSPAPTGCAKDLTLHSGAFANMSCSPAEGAGAIWNGGPLEPPVIPAKAGIQSVESTFPKVCGVDSRFRGND